jgi:subtilisin
MDEFRFDDHVTLNDRGRWAVDPAQGGRRQRMVRSGRRADLLVRATLALVLLAPLVLTLSTPLSSDAAKPGHDRANRDKSAKPIPDHYIVVLAEAPGKPAVSEQRGRGRSRAQVKAAAQGLAHKHNAKVHQVYSTLLEGFAAEVPADKLKELQQDPEVAAVVPDYEVELAAQTVPKNIKFVKADQNPTANINGVDERVNADVAVLDTGISKQHPDLNVVGGYNCTSDDTADWVDRNGHGTHVAGIIGAKDNDIGGVGVAPGVRLWAVKVIPDRATASDATVMCGLDWIYEFANVIEVVNASIGRKGSPIIDGNGLTASGGCFIYIRPNIDIYHYMWCRIAEIGIPVVVAAMNWSIDAKDVVPAAFDEVMTVSNMTWGSIGKRRKTLVSLYRDTKLGSNFGADVDIAAPGANILSTLPGRAIGKSKQYGQMTGTSMAAPHVAGAAALYIAAHGRNDSALLVMNAIKSRATLVPLQGDPDGITEGYLNVADLWRP